MITHKQLTEWFGGTGNFGVEDCMEVLLSLINHEYTISAFKRDIYEDLEIEDKTGIVSHIEAELERPTFYGDDE